MKEIRVQNLKSTRTGEKVANQFLIINETDNTETFQSYDSTIAIVDWNEKTIKIGNDWNYSTTTGKYRNVFFDMMNFPDIANTKGMKKAVEKARKQGFALIQSGWFDDELFKLTLLEK